MYLGILKQSGYTYKCKNNVTPLWELDEFPISDFATFYECLQPLILKKDATNALIIPQYSIVQRSTLITDNG